MRKFNWKNGKKKRGKRFKEIKEFKNDRQRHFKISLIEKKEKR